MRQAGETIECACGAKLEVPTMRGLRRLEPALETPHPPRSVWGPRQGLLFLGLLLTAVSLAAGGYAFFATMPSPDLTTSQEALDTVGPVEAWRYWMAVRDGIPSNPTGEVAAVLQRTRNARIEIQIALGCAVAGLALAASGLLVKPKRL